MMDTYFYVIGLICLGFASWWFDIMAGGFASVTKTSDRIYLLVVSLIPMAIGISLILIYGPKP